MWAVMRTGSQRRHLDAAGHGQKAESDGLERTAEVISVWCWSETRATNVHHSHRFWRDQPDHKVLSSVSGAMRADAQCIIVELDLAGPSRR
jgi:hypothetical protein